MKVGITSAEELAAYRYGSTLINILSENVGRYKIVFRLFSFSACNPAKTEVSYDTTEGGIGLEKDSALYQLMDTRMHSVMNGIVSSDGEYQAILRSRIYTPANWTGWIYQKKSGC